MKPSKIRNRTIHHPSHTLRSKMMSSHLSADLRKNHHTRSIRVVPGDSVKIARGEYRDVTGKVDKVDPSKGVVISGTKKEKMAGQKFDVYIHPSNLLVTALNTDDKWRTKKIKGTIEPPPPPSPTAKKEADEPVDDDGAAPKKETGEAPRGEQ